MAEFEDKKISDLERLTGDLTPQSLFETAYTDDQREEGNYDTRAVNVEQLGRTVLNDIEYATELDTDDKTIFGAINELAQGGGGGGGSNVTMEDNPDGGVDITVEDTTKTLAKQETVANAVALKQSELIEEIEVVEKSDLDTIKADLTNLSSTVGSKADKTVTDGLNTRVTNLENTPIPEQTVANAVNSYVDAHSGGFATKADLTELEESFLHKEFIEQFRAFEVHSPDASTSTSFKGFATRYAYKGKIKRVDAYGVYYNPNGTVTVTLEVRDSEFSRVLASVTTTVESSKDSQTVSFDLDEEIASEGNVYIAVNAIDGFFRVKNNISPFCSADASHSNKYIPSSANDWRNVNGYNVDVTIYADSLVLKNAPIPNIKHIGNKPNCDYPDVQSALNAITDDTEDNPYIFYVLPGVYPSFTMAKANEERTIDRTKPRYISLIGYDRKSTIFFDNRGNYLFSPCEIWTNGTIKNLSFVDKADAEHHTQESGRTMAYAVHLDFGKAKTRFENCYFYSNAGAGIGIGTWGQCEIEFENCRFESDVDGTFGAGGHGAFFCHTSSSGKDTDRSNQKLKVHNCIAVATSQGIGARLAVIAGTESTYDYELQNFGCFGNLGAGVSLQAPNDDLLSSFCFNNIPTILNKA